MQIREFQALMRNTYHHRDGKRGIDRNALSSRVAQKQGWC